MVRDQTVGVRIICAGVRVDGDGADKLCRAFGRAWRSSVKSELSVSKFCAGVVLSLVCPPLV